VAARILADLAQPWSIPDLIALLGDNDKEIRYHAAKALKRLTQQTFGRQPEDWRKLPPFACEEARRNRQAWWQENQQRYPRAFDVQSQPNRGFRKFVGFGRLFYTNPKRKRGQAVSSSGTPSLTLRVSVP
jgi:hypothetical protein